MAAEEEDECPKCPDGLPAWMATFSDLMALLMCFFVLLLSFSEMDALKFKRMAGSLRNAFGVQRMIEANAIPKGTSIIARQFSPGKPQPTVIQEIRQQTVDELKDSLEVLCQDPLAQEDQPGDKETASAPTVTVDDAAIDEQVREEAAKIAEALAEEISEGLLEIESINQIIIVRVKEQSFGGGSDYLADDFLPVLDRIRTVLKQTQGEIYVEGHTDSLPIRSTRFRNNWVLSTARALAVAEYLFADPEMSQNRFVVVGHSDTRPIASNSTAQGRSENRRVEIIIRKDNPDFLGPEPPDPDELNPGAPELFGLDPDEIF